MDQRQRENRLKSIDYNVSQMKSRTKELLEERENILKQYRDDALLERGQDESNKPPPYTALESRLDMLEQMFEMLHEEIHQIANETGCDLSIRTNQPPATSPYPQSKFSDLLEKFRQSYPPSPNSKLNGLRFRFTQRPDGSLGMELVSAPENLISQDVHLDAGVVHTTPQLPPLQFSPPSVGQPLLPVCIHVAQCLGCVPAWLASLESYVTHVRDVHKITLILPKQPLLYYVEEDGEVGATQYPAVVSTLLSNDSSREED